MINLPQDTGQSPQRMVGVGSGSVGPTIITGETASDINNQLVKHIAAIRADLLRRLIFLNLGALLLGAGLSTYLARKTLRPIEAAVKTQARFSSDASHELRTPLTALRARNEVALRKADLTLAEAKTVMQTSIDQAIRLEALSEGLLQMSRQEGKDRKKTPVLLGEVADEAINQMRELATAKHVTIREAIPPITVMGDKQDLVQVVTILLDNAVKYSDKRGTVSLKGSVVKKQAMLRVRDNGPGILARDLPHIFERFYRADHSRTKRGYGLGLSIAARLVDQCGGEITVETAPGKGSIFTIHLPKL